MTIERALVGAIASAEEVRVTAGRATFYGRVESLSDDRSWVILRVRNQRHRERLRVANITDLVAIGGGR